VLAEGGDQPGLAGCAGQGGALGDGDAFDAQQIVVLNPADGWNHDLVGHQVLAQVGVGRSSRVRLHGQGEVLLVHDGLELGAFEQSHVGSRGQGVGDAAGEGLGLGSGNVSGAFSRHDRASERLSLGRSHKRCNHNG
jgi:hypothetical protein